jgi:hypothetical protein
MINEDDYKPKDYLNELVLNEIEIVSGMVPMEIFTLGSKEVWLLNFSLGKFIRRKLLKRAMHLTIDDPRHLRKISGSSTAQVRQYDLHIRHIERSRIIDQGMVHLKLRMNPMKKGWFSAGVVFDIFDFQGMKTLKKDDYFRLRIQKSKQERRPELPEEPTLDGEIMRLTDLSKR